MGRYVGQDKGPRRSSLGSIFGLRDRST